MYPFFHAHLLLSLVHPWNQSGQLVFTSMMVSVVVIVVKKPLSPPPIPRQSGNTMVVVVVVVVVIIVAVVGAHCTWRNANYDLTLIQIMSSWSHYCFIWYVFEYSNCQFICHLCLVSFWTFQLILFLKNISVPIVHELSYFSCKSHCKKQENIQTFIQRTFFAPQTNFL